MFAITPFISLMYFNAMGIVGGIILILRSIFGLFVLSAIPWVLVELLAPLVRSSDLKHVTIVGTVLLFLAVLGYKSYLVLSAYPCPHYVYPDVTVSGCGFSVLISLLPQNFGTILLAWVLASLFFAVGLVTYVYIPEDLNIHLRRYVATLAAVAVALVWVVIFPWSVPLLFGL